MKRLSLPEDNLCFLSQVSTDWEGSGAISLDRVSECYVVTVR